MMGNPELHLTVFILRFAVLFYPGYFLQLRGKLRYYNSYLAPLCKHTPSVLSLTLI